LHVERTLHGAFGGAFGGAVCAAALVAAVGIEGRAGDALLAVGTSVSLLMRRAV